ncbi:ABC transporter ATP-binding protein [Variovorax saccharolyticus]|uniref:ABC transporter ATP-binding protein n=1 Tax=Variovorax saccharolyticus TaxID=3053516 RepID=UPI00257699F5|nr:ABC transporter ATP-binding protein [Variovorax sp. J22R187]MDM0021901.1 ABC transporter ATP-binding protein [Variovorax sp. J22R187]
MPQVNLEKVVRRFGGVAAVDEVSISMPDGAFVTLLGPSGCGKTTTLRMIAGLEANDEGRIQIGERVVSDANAGVFVSPDRRDLGMVFQSYAIWPHMTVFENVAYPLRARHVASGQIATRVNEALEMVEMGAYAQRPAPALSGGQQQRVAIARSLVSRPQVLLMDEPLSNLDAKLREQMRIELRALQQRLRITTVYVTHDQREAMELSDHVVVMHAGRVQQAGAPEQIYARPSTHTVASFMGSPNLVRARVTGRADGPDGALLDVEGQGWAGRCPGVPALRAGDDAWLIVRPESIRLDNDARACAAGISWHGEIQSTSYQGAMHAIRVAIPDAVIHAEVEASRRPRVGENVVLRADAAQAWVVPAEAGQ